MEKIDVDALLDDIETSCKELLTKNRFKLHMFFFSKYEEAEQCFDSAEENEDFFEMIEHIAEAYNQSPIIKNKIAAPGTHTSGGIFSVVENASYK